MYRGVTVLVSLVGLAACSHEPIEYIPSADRALLLAQSRLGDSGSAAKPVSVDQMLRQARVGPDAAPGSDNAASASSPVSATPVPDGPLAAAMALAHAARPEKENVPASADVLSGGAPSGPRANEITPPGPGMNVADMLRQARLAKGGGVATRRLDDNDGFGTPAPALVHAMPREDEGIGLILRFTDRAVTLEAAAKVELQRFAAMAKGKLVSVTSRAGGFNAGAALLGQRRALAVARDLAPVAADVEMRFSDEAPEDGVLLSIASPLRLSAAP